MESGAESIVQSETASPVQVLLWGPDTLYFSSDFGVNTEMRARLKEEKRLAQELAKAGAVHCPEWLEARVRPTGAKGGYAYLVETDGFTIKILGDGIPNRPGLYFELRSLFLHTHPHGAHGACEEALAWARTQLLADQGDGQVRERVPFAAAKLSRADIHWIGRAGMPPRSRMSPRICAASSARARPSGASTARGTPPPATRLAKG
jgi:hypothetical protein